jgi:hypothetical protein
MMGISGFKKSGFHGLSKLSGLFNSILLFNYSFLYLHKFTLSSENLIHYNHSKVMQLR